jgi:hypothetical protein
VEVIPKGRAWFDDRPHDSSIWCDIAATFVRCSFSGPYKFWFKADGSFALLKWSETGGSYRLVKRL